LTHQLGESTHGLVVLTCKEQLAIFAPQTLHSSLLLLIHFFLHQRTRNASLLLFFHVLVLQLRRRWRSIHDSESRSQRFNRLRLR